MHAHPPPRALLALPLLALALLSLACSSSTESPPPSLPEIHIENVLCLEGNVGRSDCTVPVRLSGPGTANAVFRITVDASESTATEGVDFTFSPVELSIPAGETGIDLSFSILGDTVVEPDEGVSLRLAVVSGATPAMINGIGAYAQITNDDAPPPTTTIRVENRVCAEGNRGTSTCPLTVRLSGPAPAPVSFTLALAPSGSTATLAIDFLFAAASVTIPTGGEVAEVPLTIVGDYDAEPDEVVEFSLEGVTGAAPAEINGRGARVLITNDDASTPPASPAPLGSPRFQHTVTSLPDGRVFIAGGHDGAQEVASTQLLSDDGRTLAAGPALPEPRARHSATLLADGRVLLVGGLTAGSPLALASTVLCDLAANACTRGPAMTTGRLNHAAVELADHRVLVAGGVPNYGVASNLDSAELFAAGPDRFAAAENDLPRATDSAAAARLPNGEVLIAGGAGDATGRQLVRYRPGTGFSLDASSLQHERVAATATLLADGRVMLAGGLGQATTEFVTLDADPTRPLWVGPGPDMAQSRYLHAALVLADGRVLLSGGYTWDAATSTLSARSTVELFAPALNGFSAGASLSVGRGEFGAALLGSGHVAHVGGSDGARPSATMDVLRP